MFQRIHLKTNEKDQLMPWVKSGTEDRPVYRLSDKYYHYVENGSVSLDEMNDLDNEITVCGNVHYLVQQRDEVHGVIPILPSGLYRLQCANMYDPFRMVPWAPATATKLFKLDVVEDILKDFNQFREQEQLYTDLQMAYKRGALLYGPPGTGKTSAINMIIESLNLENVLIIYVDSGLPSGLLVELKEDKRLKVFIFEELTQTLDKTNISRFLTFLDGEHSLENCYIIATTNYPEDLPGNIVDRPGRFDKLFKIKDVSSKDKKVYLEYYLGREVTDQELRDMKSFSMAYLKELILKIKKDNLTVDEAIASLAKHKRTVKDNFKPETGGIGFTSNSDDD